MRIALKGVGIVEFFEKSTQLLSHRVHRFVMKAVRQYIFTEILK